MATCWDNLIGIRGACGDPVAPLSDLYIQDLTFIDIKVADAVVQDQVSGYQLIRDKINYAIQAVKNEAQALLAPRFTTTSILENAVIGQYTDSMQAVAAEAGQLKGVYLDIQERPYLELFISDISLYTDHTGDIDVEVYNLITGELLDTITVPAEAGEIITVNVHKSYFTGGRRMKLFIGYDATGIASYASSLQTGTGRNCLSCSGGPSYYDQYARFYTGKVSTALTPISTNVKPTTSTAGLSLTYSLNCSFEQLLCTMRNVLAWPMLHKAGAEICKEVRFTKRLNSVSMLDKSSAEALQPEYERIYLESMESILQNHQLPNDICVKCNQRVKTTVRIP